MSVVDELVDKFKRKLAIQEAATNGRYAGDREENVLTNLQQTTDLELVGYMAFSIAKCKQPPAIWIDDLFVHPKFQGQGIATKFFEYIATNKRSDEYNEIHLIVRTNSEQQRHARSLYTKLSFTDITNKGQQRQQYEPDQNQIYMAANRKELLNNITNMKNNHDDAKRDTNFFFVHCLENINLLTRRSNNIVYNQLQQLYELFHHTPEGDQAHWNDTEKCAIADDSMLILAFRPERNASTTRSGLPIVRLNLSKEHLLATYKSFAHKKTQAHTQAHTHRLQLQSTNKF